MLLLVLMMVVLSLLLLSLLLLQLLCGIVGCEADSGIALDAVHAVVSGVYG